LPYISRFPIVNQFFSFLQTKLLQACCVWNDFPNICLLKLKSCLSHSYTQSAIFLRSVRMTTHSGLGENIKFVNYNSQTFEIYSQLWSSRIYFFSKKNIEIRLFTRKYMHAETLALLTKPLYFPNMKYLKYQVIWRWAKGLGLATE
jgi:hypothetical protein